MFKYGYKYRIKGYEELLKEKGIRKIDENGTLFKDKPIGYLKEMNRFANKLFNIRCLEGTKYIFVEDRTIETWMCECLGEVIEPIYKFEVGKTYKVLSWDELLRVKGIVLSNDGSLYKNNNRVFKSYVSLKAAEEPFEITNGPILENGNIFREGWIFPWMCRENETKEKSKKRNKATV